MTFLNRILFACLVVVPGMVANAQSPPWPVAAPDDWLLAFIDIETTGLIPGYHEMIDIGIVMTDLDGVELDSLFIAQSMPMRRHAGSN